MEHSAVTYKKIAEALNVSQSTVSKALSGSREISAELSEKIYMTAKDMGYFSMKRERNREYAKNFRPKIAVLIPEIISIHYSQLATKFSNEIEAHGGKASLYITGFSHQNVSELLDEIYDEVRFDGVIMLCACNYSGEIKLPTMLLSESQADKCDSIYSNLEPGMNAAIKHLVSLGHSKIGFAGEIHTIGKELLFKKNMEQNRLSINEDHIFRISERFESIGTEVGRLIASMEKRPTAIIAAYDEIAIGLISSLAEHGINVPSDISVVGMNDIPVAKYLNPPLTTITPNTNEKCTLAVELLFRRIYKKKTEKIESHTELSSSLTVRESTAKAKN